MSDLSLIPIQDGFETQLSQEWNGATGTVYVLATPSYTPTTTNTYIVVNPGKTNMQIAEITDYDSTAKTLTVSSISFEKGLGISSTQQTHTTGSKVIISDNYQFWADIKTAINSKLDDTGGTMTGLLEFSGTTHGGIKVNSLTTVQRDALTPANGLIIYNTTAGEFQIYQGGAWSTVASGSTQPNASTTVLGKIKTDVTPASDPVALIKDNPKYDALAGTSGIPSGTNKYVTNDDTSTAATADKVARRLAGGNITVVTESPGNNTTNAASTAFVTAGLLAIASAFDTLTFTRVISTASGTQVINHNLGKTPKNITFSCLGALNLDVGSTLRQCFGGYDGTTNNCVTTDIGAGVVGASNTYSIAFEDTGYSNAYVGSITAWDSTTFTITWTKTGTPTGTINIFATLIA